MQLVLSCVVGGLLATIPVLAAEQTWTGQISDSMCGAKHMSADHTVNLTGDLTGETIRVAKVEMPKGTK